MNRLPRQNLTSVENTQNLIQPAAAALRLLSTATGSDPDRFRLEESNELLYRVLISAPQIDAAYVSFEDGYHRVVTRIDDARRRSDPKIPPTANWHSSYIDDFSVGKSRGRHRLFFDRWPHEIGGYNSPTTLDIRTLAGYQEAKESKALAITEPTINPDTGYPVISVRVPILHKGEFIGCASVNITLDILSSFLARHRTSANGVTMIADAIDGTIIAHSNQRQSVRAVDGKVEVARLDTIADDNVREAYRLQRELATTPSFSARRRVARRSARRSPPFQAVSDSHGRL